MHLTICDGLILLEPRQTFIQSNFDIVYRVRSYAVERKINDLQEVTIPISPLFFNRACFNCVTPKAKQCLCHKPNSTKIIGATAAGKKEVVGITDGYRESAESWKEMLLALAIGDGGLGFWKALPQVFGTTRVQRLQSFRQVIEHVGGFCVSRDHLNEIVMGESRAAAEQALDRFLLSCEAKYPKATECLAQRSRSVVDVL